MAQIPEDLIQLLMQMSGESRSSVEKKAEQAFAEVFANRNKYSVKPKKTSKKKPTYTEESYPHYLSARKAQKYILRITLRGIKPAIWRKIEVPSNITLRHLGNLIIDLMGWDGYHLNQFRKHNDYFMPFYQRDASGESDFMWDCNNYNQEDYTIADLFQKKTQTYTFEYDFGDSWEHEIRLSSIDEYKADEPHQIVFVGGKCACPPEDSGGIWGYQKLLETLSKHKSGKRLTSDERESLEWAGWDKDYDPEYLDLDHCRMIVEQYNR